MVYALQRIMGQRITDRCAPGVRLEWGGSDAQASSLLSGCRSNEGCPVDWHHPWSADSDGCTNGGDSLSRFRSPRPARPLPSAWRDAISRGVASAQPGALAVMPRPDRASPLRAVFCEPLPGFLRDGKSVEAEADRLRGAQRRCGRARAGRRELCALAVPELRRRRRAFAAGVFRASARGGNRNRGRSCCRSGTDRSLAQRVHRRLVPRRGASGRGLH